MIVCMSSEQLLERVKEKEALQEELRRVIVRKLEKLKMSRNEVSRQCLCRRGSKRWVRQIILFFTFSISFVQLMVQYVTMKRGPSVARSRFSPPTPALQAIRLMFDRVGTTEDGYLKYHGLISLLHHLNVAYRSVGNISTHAGY